MKENFRFDMKEHFGFDVKENFGYDVKEHFSRTEGYSTCSFCPLDIV